MRRRPSYPELTVLSLCRWSLASAVRFPGALALTCVTLVVNVGLNVLRPWPTAFFVDYVLRGQTMPPAMAGIVEGLLGPQTPLSLLNWVVASTFALFLLGWAVGLANGYATMTLYQRMSYDLATEIFL